ncbi:MAG: ribonuclease HII [Opitutales bacterium]|nr:ribonuclease HII [Opitutales bacterium]
MIHLLAAFDRCRLFPCKILAGIDEAGRGALAGPVVAGAVIAPLSFYEDARALKLLEAANDSKKLTAARREMLFSAICSLAEDCKIAFSPGVADVNEIAEHNILGATKLAMQRALLAAVEKAPFAVELHSLLPDSFFGLSDKCEAAAQLLVDGKPLKNFPYAHEAIVQGDGQSLVIALSSIVAKVTRDHMMLELDSCYPQYGFIDHKGYGVESHREAILTHGPCPEHRELFLRKIRKGGYAALEQDEIDF